MAWGGKDWIRVWRNLKDHAYQTWGREDSGVWDDLPNAPVTPIEYAAQILELYLNAVDGFMEYGEKGYFEYWAQRQRLSGGSTGHPIIDILARLKGAIDRALHIKRPGGKLISPREILAKPAKNPLLLSGPDAQEFWHASSKLSIELMNTGWEITAYEEWQAIWEGVKEGWENVEDATVAIADKAGAAAARAAVLAGRAVGGGIRGFLGEMGLVEMALLGGGAYLVVTRVL